ncbi:MAG TPA: hypothetical protein PK733_19165 [Clostridiales bacterium]|nr:hypothetical protein [Clostridiales bacterium]
MSKNLIEVCHKIEVSHEFTGEKTLEEIVKEYVQQIINRKC